MSDEAKVTKVYLLVECEVETHPSGYANPGDSKIAEMARETLFKAMAYASDDADSRDLWFHWLEGGVSMKEPTILPDDIEHILFRDKMSHVSTAEALRMIKEKWGADPLYEDIDDE